ncbi:hypothetical protein GCM10027194_23870 [Thalassiella azotivora]
MGGIHTEVERTYTADDDAELPAVSELLRSADGAVDPTSVLDGDVAQHELSATYFDTADLRLAAAGLTLRRRTGGDDAGWHLKVPAGDDTRTEVRRPLGRATRTVPAALRRMVRAVTADAPLQPVVEVTTRRAVRRLVDATGQVLVELADDRVTARRLLPVEGNGDDVTAATTWREVEVELVGGQPALLDHLDTALRDRGLRPSASSSKLRRALGDAVDATPTTRGSDDAPPMKRSTPAGQVVMAYVREQVEQIHRQDLPVRLDADGGVHAMRVATRRLRSALRSFRPLLDRSVTDPLRDELTWLAGELGRARDAEVMGARLRTAAEADEETVATDPLDAVDAELGRAYRDAHDALLEHLDGDRYHALLAALRDLVAGPPFTERAARPARKALPRRVRRDWVRLRDVMAGAADVPAGDERDAVLHEARKAAKRARYAAEAVAPAFGEPASHFAAAIEDLQEVLGEHQDSVVARQHLHELARRAPTNEASSRNAYCQPTAPARTGTAWMLATVKANPIAVWAVSAVPTNRGSATSDSAVEKTPESAMTDAPHTAQNTARTGAGATNASGDSRQQAPLTASAVTAAVDRPNRSAAHPPSRQPSSPNTPMATKTSSGARVPSPSEAADARTNRGIHVHRAYSSHMCPK